LKSLDCGIFYNATFGGAASQQTARRSEPLFGRHRRYHPRVLSDTPSFAAITLVAPGVRFNAFDILVTPAFDFAIDFIKRTSSLLQGRGVRFLVFLAI
jgi:hypothetical protein